MKKNRKMLMTMIIFYIVLLVTLLILILPSALVIIKEDLFRYIGPGTVMTILSVIVVCLTALILLLYNIYSRNSDDRGAENIYMNEERSYLERQINEINKKLVSSDERWMEAYHLVISSQNKQVDKTGKISTAAFLKGFGIDVQDIEIQSDLAFILTPFHKDFRETYSVVCEACSEIKLKPIRGDEEYISDDILKHIIKNIVRARLIIAILDGRNPNVFYELGIAHSLNKPTILLANTQTKIPFDLQNQYFILYKNEGELKDDLKNALFNILASGQ